jgi:hypothetical protein
VLDLTKIEFLERINEETGESSFKAQLCLESRVRYTGIRKFASASAWRLEAIEALRKEMWSFVYGDVRKSLKRLRREVECQMMVSSDPAPLVEIHQRVELLIQFVGYPGITTADT